MCVHTAFCVDGPALGPIRIGMLSPASYALNAVPRNRLHRARPAPPRRRRLRAACATGAAVGIDLGTTNSVVAVLRAGDAAPSVLTTDGRALGAAAGAAAAAAASGVAGFTIPSVAAVDATGRWLVGAAAVAQMESNPLNSYYSAKRLIGRRYADVAAAAPQLVYRIAEGARGGVALACPHLGQDLTPQQVRGMTAAQHTARVEPAARGMACCYERPAARPKRARSTHRSRRLSLTRPPPARHAKQHAAPRCPPRCCGTRWPWRRVTWTMTSPRLW